MHTSLLSRLFLPLLFLFSGALLAAAGSVVISSPGQGAVLSASAENMIEYEIVPGPHGSHSHLYVDGKETAVLRQLKGSYRLPELSSGEHELCIKVVNRAHTPIGVEQCVNVTVQ